MAPIGAPPFSFCSPEAPAHTPTAPPPPAPLSPCSCTLGHAHSPRPPALQSTPLFPPCQFTRVLSSFTIGTVKPGSTLLAALLTMRALLAVTLLLLHAAVDGLHVFDRLAIFSQRSQCKLIPPSLHLCHDIEYAEMRLPNLLGHEAMSEVLQQAASWVPLVQKRCHPDTRKFLCSLFAPVCLKDVEEPIRPCRSLCEAVRSGCAPVMAAFGFPWPEMLRCARFPPDDDLCIPAGENGEHVTNVTVTVPKVCDACKEKIEDDNEIVDSLCRNDFALKIKVKEITYTNGDTKIVPETKNKTIYKLNGVTERDLRKAALLLKDGLQCVCEEMNDFNASYLVMGQKQDGDLVITSLKRWQKGQREFKRISRSIRKLQC